MCNWNLVWVDRSFLTCWSFWWFSFRISHALVVERQFSKCGFGLTDMLNYVFIHWGRPFWYLKEPEGSWSWWGKRDGAPRVRGLRLPARWGTGESLSRADLGGSLWLLGGEQALGTDKEVRGWLRELSSSPKWETMVARRDGSSRDEKWPDSRIFSQQGQADCWQTACRVGDKKRAQGSCGAIWANMELPSAEQETDWSRTVLAGGFGQAGQETGLLAKDNWRHAGKGLGLWSGFGSH